jgi:hypothetical protein
MYKIDTICGMVEEDIMGKRLLSIFLFILVLNLSTWSQEVTGDLEGCAVDTQGMPLGDVDVIVEGAQLIGLRTAKSDSQGHFRVSALPAGSYQIKLVHMAYQEVIIEEVVIRLGKTTVLGEITIPDKIQEAYEVVVTASVPVIDPVSTNIGGNLSPEEFESLPVDRDYTSLAELLPHSNSSYYGDETNIAGSTGLENKYFIDGTDVTDPFRGLSGVDLPYNFVREVEVRSGGYQAEFGSSLGGILNVITYSGGNTFSGQAFGFFANNRFTAEPRQSALEPSRGDFSMYDFGLSIGGPVVKDKLWFYGAYNPAFEQEEVEIPGLSFYQDKNTIHRFAGKLTWQVNSRNNVIFSIMGDPSHRNGVGETFFTLGTPRGLLNPDPYLEEIQRGGIYLSFRGTHIITSKFFLETMLSRGTSREKNVPLTEIGQEEIAFIDNMTGFWSGGSFSEIDVDSIRTMVLVKGTLNLAGHILKAGVEFKDNALEGYIQGKFLIRYSPFSYLENYTLLESKVRNRTLGGFIQDSWRVHPRFRLNLGMRWEGQYLYGSDGKLAQSITDQFQPRLGFVFLTKSDGSQRLFGSAGRFYQDLSTWFSFQHMVEGTVFESKYYDHDPRIDPSGGMTFVQVGNKSPWVDGLMGQHFDEFTLGYEIEIFSSLRLGGRGIYRVLREGIDDAEDPVTQRIVYGNPGRGTLKDYPEINRQYIALELTLNRIGRGPFNFFTSYVLSRNEGNYPGLFNADRDQKRPNADLFFNKLDAIINYLPEFEGLLPNDRTHVFKFSSWYHFDFGLSAGVFIIWQSGTPLNEFGGLYLVQPWQILLVPRGSAGRTPVIFDLNLRFTYDFSRILPQLKRTRLVLDIFHVGSKRTPVNYEQVHYFNQDMMGNQINPNPNYGLASRYQPPMSFRLGLEIGF